MNEELYTKALHDLLKENKNVPIDDVIHVLEPKGRIGFNPEVTFGGLPENLPVCLAARAQRFDILAYLMLKFHPYTDFSFRLTMIPAGGSMDLVPLNRTFSISFRDFIILACCNNYDVCTQMLALVTGRSKGLMNGGNVVPLIRPASLLCMDCRILKQLLSDVLILPVDENNRTCLHLAAMSCGASTDPHAQIIVVMQELVKVRRSLDEFDKFGLTALQYACRAGCLPAVKLLIEAGADVNKYNGSESCTALHLAVITQNISVVHELLRAGAETNAEVFCSFVGEEHVNITGDPADVARSVGNYRLARFVADPLRSSLGILLDSDPNGDGASAILFEPTPGEEVDGTCDICMEETKLLPLGRCHHAFCKSCLAEWFNNNSNGVTRPQCPQSSCNVPVSIYDIGAVLGKEKADRLDDLLLQRSLAEMPDFRWCPRCSNGGFFQGPCVDAECMECGYKFCTECQQEAHPGISCERKAFLLVDERAAVGTTRWLAANTKPCPACHVPITKFGGCSHMRCSRCGYEFCWYCLGKYIGLYTFEPRCPCGRAPRSVEDIMNSATFVPERRAPVPVPLGPARGRPRPGPRPQGQRQGGQEQAQPQGPQPYRRPRNRDLPYLH